jgi:hypothetical protein
MDFGTTIPLFFISLCLLFVTWILGTGLVITLIFRVKDRQLTRNVLLTVIAVSTIWFLFPLAQAAYALIRICRDCPDISSFVTFEVLLSTLSFSARTLFFGIPCGYIIAFGLVVPVTLAVRSYKKGRTGES